MKSLQYEQKQITRLIRKQRLLISHPVSLRRKPKKVAVTDPHTRI